MNISVGSSTGTGLPAPEPRALPDFPYLSRSNRLPLWANMKEAALPRVPIRGSGPSAGRPRPARTIPICLIFHKEKS